jgi:hypothetical protein
MKEQQSASSPDEIAVFQAYTDLINSERETLWARHNALLLANSLIIGALAISPTALWENKWAALAMLSAGLVISAAWIGIAVQGWRAMLRHVEVAGVYAAADAGLAVGGGARAIVLANQKGAVLELSGRQVGLMANADLSGLAITLK